jgi:hypothetical protein
MKNSSKQVACLNHMDGSNSTCKKYDYLIKKKHKKPWVFNLKVIPR